MKNLSVVGGRTFSVHTCCSACLSSFSPILLHCSTPFLNYSASASVGIGISVSASASFGATASASVSASVNVSVSATASASFRVS